MEEQLRFLVHVIKGVNIDFMVPLLNGSFASWIWKYLGIPVGISFIQFQYYKSFGYL